ncbi:MULTISPECIES: hypothetical protein [Amycolatopsis]|uniref:hypothetical protein n=1 Tax=Amycolatopsis TaxID=1813 RepID=UPI0004280069|nr:hypothetical protein [Amycolatopsis thermoflava]
MTAREALEAYAGQENPRGVPFQILEAAAPKAFDALRAVLDMHRPVDRGTGPQCAGCATHVTFTPWPCKNVAAIEEALR